MLRANRNGFYIRKRGGATNVTIGDAGVNGVLTNHATDAENLNLENAAHGQVNLTYLRDKTKPYTIVDGKYRGFKIFSDQQTVDLVANVGNPTEANQIINATDNNDIVNKAFLRTKFDEVKN